MRGPRSLLSRPTRLLALAIAGFLLSAPQSPVAAARDAGGSDIALPRPLSAADAASVRRALGLIDAGKTAEVDAALAELGETPLAGTLLARKYLGPRHKSSAAELSNWLTRFPDHADAPAIHALARKRAPKGAAVPPLPERELDPEPGGEAADWAEDADLACPRDPDLERAVRRAETPAEALALIARAKPAPAIAARARAEAARVAFLANRDRDALAMAQAAHRAAPRAQRGALAPYVAGLAAWRLERVAAARDWFETAARAPMASPADRAAAAVWAARAHTRLREHDAAEAWLRLAADGPVGFHAMLARRMLGLPTGIQPGEAVLTTADIDAVAETGPGRRALALLQAGRPDLAEAEFRLLATRARAEAPFARALALVAAQVGAHETAGRAAGYALAAAGRASDLPRLAIPAFRPNGGFKAEPALIYALAKLESNFEPNALSPVGARGLMQVTPIAARQVAGEQWADDSRLHDPGVNLDIGQRYLAHLAAQRAVDGDLIRLLASYNSGPAAVRRWGADIRDQGDPLLFLEAIPAPETRAFVQRALTWSWLYAARLHRPAPSLDALADGRFPRFEPVR